MNRDESRAAVQAIGGVRGCAGDVGKRARPDDRRKRHGRIALARQALQSPGMTESAIRIAMWSGPRNLSTALMRSFSSRDDTTVLDEPFYAHYLRETGIDHPGREQVMGAYENDWRQVMQYITGAVPGGKTIWYQKHMAHHMLPHIDTRPLIEAKQMMHAFLIRNPIEVIASYAKVYPNMTLAETGLPCQVDLFNRVKESSGAIPAVVDAKDLLLDPKRVLDRLCEKLGIAFTEQMLSWPAGPHPEDGAWAPFWYERVYQSTGFEKYQPKNEAPPARYAPVCDEATRLYEVLASHRL